MSATPFTFGIPLIARAAAQDWSVVQALLRLTLRSLAAQTDRRFCIIVAGHDRPNVGAGAPPFEFHQADWPAEAVRSDNGDAGRKKFLVAEHVGGRGGYLMFVDADDWVDTRIVASVRAGVGAAADGPVGGVIRHGYAIDLRNRRALPIPSAGAFTGGFYELCGSSTVARIDPGAEATIRRDPYALLHEHYRWEDTCREHGVASAPLDVVGADVTNTPAHQSTSHGPVTSWRRDFDVAVATEGRDVDDAFLARFGLCGHDLRGVDALLNPR